MCDPNVFEQFSPPVYYPRVVPQYLPSAPVPTNSWFQNALSSQIQDYDRIVNTNPWYWIPRYADPIGVSFDHELDRNTSVVLSGGNFSVMNTPNPNGAFTIEGTNVQAEELYDMSAKLKITTGGGFINGYPTRGSPFVNLVYSNTPVNLKWISQGITSLNPIANGYQVESNASKISNVSENLYVQSDGKTYKSKFMAIYDGVIPTNQKVEVTLKPNVVNFKLLGLDLNRSLNSHYQEFVPPNVISITNSEDVVGFKIFEGTTIYVITVNVNTKVATLTKTVPVHNRWLIYTTANLSLANNTISTAGNFNDLVQIAALGSESGQYAILTSLYQNYIGAYTTKFNTSNYNITTFQIDLNLVGGKSLHLMPVHWNNYTVSNVTKPNTPKFPDLVYGNMSYYQFNNNTSNVNMGPFTIPDNLDLSSLSSASKNILKTRVIIDAQITQITTNLNPYDYGIQAATAGKIIALAKSLGIETNTDVVTLKNTLIESLTKWLNNTNTPEYRLTYEPIWKGVIVPADSDAVVNKDPTAYGNSFYNDHHFHYGYIIYAIWCAELYQNTLSTNFPAQIQNLLCDVCNPDPSSTFSTKVRHKDFYGGHSWATGVGSPNPSDTTKKLSPVRQQESSGEAINCYYACYLLSGLLGDNDTKKTAAVALKTEFDSSLAYYQLFGEGTSYGDFQKVAGIGILDNLGKEYTLDWQMQPNTYPGRSLGIYGIQAIPFTEISFQHISTEWTNKMVSNSDSLYQISSTLVEGLNNNSYTPQLPSITQDNFNVETEGGFWGNVGNMLLSKSSLVMDSSINTSWHNLQQKQMILMGGNTAIKHFNSYSHTLYWLMRNGSFDQTLCGAVTQVKVLDIKVILIHQDGANVTKIIINGCGGCGKILIKADFDLCSILKGEGNLGEKGLSLGANPNDIVNYVGTKLAIQNNICITEDPEEFMSESNNDLFITELMNKACNLNKHLTPYPNFFTYFK